MELQGGTIAAVGIIGSQGVGNLRHSDLSFFWLQAGVRGTQVTLKKVQSEKNMADLGTKALERDTMDRHMEKLKCVRFDK